VISVGASLGQEWQPWSVGASDHLLFFCDHWNYRTLDEVAWIGDLLIINVDINQFV
jgi:hypothetical protein